MPQPYLVDRRDPSRVYLYSEILARNPFLEESSAPPPAYASIPGADDLARHIASRMDVDERGIARAREANATMMQSGTRASDNATAKNVAAKAARTAKLAPPPAKAALPPPSPSLELPEASLPE
jgi:hypothetical protein